MVAPLDVTLTVITALELVLVASTRSSRLDNVYSARVIETESAAGVAVGAGVEGGGVAVGTGVGGGGVAVGTGVGGGGVAVGIGVSVGVLGGGVAGGGVGGGGVGVGAAELPFTPRLVLCVAPPPVPVSVTTVFPLTGEVLTVKLTKFCPAGMVTLAGTLAMAVLLLLKLTCNPPAGALVSMPAVP